MEFTKEDVLIWIANIDDKFKALKDIKKPKSKKKIDDDEDLEEEEEKPKVEKKKAKAKKADPKPTQDNNFKLDDNFMDQVELMKRGAEVKRDLVAGWVTMDDLSDEDLEALKYAK